MTTLQIAKPFSLKAFELIKFASSICLIALSAQLSIYLPNNPVPVIWYMNLLFLYAAIKGAKQGALLTMSYLALAAAGLPLLANGACGSLYFLGPTAGYLIGMIPASFVTGYLIEKGFSKNAFYSFLAFVIGNSFVYFMGVPHLAQFVGMKQALYLGIVPFIPGFIFKNLVCTYCYQRLHR